jgi:hypothetical protein
MIHGNKYEGNLMDCYDPMYTSEWCYVSAVGPLTGDNLSIVSMSFLNMIGPQEFQIAEFNYEIFY